MLVKLLERNRETIIDSATEALVHSRLKSYNKSGKELNKQRFTVLYDLLLKSIAHKNLIPLADYIQDVTRERFTAGFNFYEVHAAINILEEQVWGTVAKEMEPGQLAESLGTVSSTLGAAKSTLANTYISLVGKNGTAKLDLSNLFKGTYGT